MSQIINSPYLSPYISLYYLGEFDCHLLYSIFKGNCFILIVSQVLLNSKLPIDVLGRVWELSDIDKDGMLDNDEFAVVRPSKTSVVLGFWDAISSCG